MLRSMEKGEPEPNAGRIPGDARIRRMERLLALVMSLLYRRTSTVGELARDFHVSERTLYRNLGLLDAAGFPLVSSPGRGGGVGLPNGFRLERHLFSPQGLALFSESLGALSDLVGDETLSSDAALAEGLVPPESPERTLEIRWDHPGSAVPGPLLRRLSASIREGRCVRLDYSDREGGGTSREVEPLRLVHHGATWYLQAFCRLRDDYRSFRVSRIRSCDPLPSMFDRPRRLRDLPPFDLRDGADAAPVLRLSVDPRARDALSYLGASGTPPASDGRIELEIRWPVDRWLVSWLCGQAPDVRVVAPEGLRARVAERLREASRAYAEP